MESSEMVAITDGEILYKFSASVNELSAWSKFREWYTGDFEMGWAEPITNPPSQEWEEWMRKMLEDHGLLAICVKLVPAGAESNELLRKQVAELQEKIKELER